MIGILYLFCGIAGFALGGVCALAWYSVTLLFGFSPPTRDQILGLMLLVASAGVIGSVGFSGLVLLLDL